MERPIETLMLAVAALLIVWALHPRRIVGRRSSSRRISLIERKNPRHRSGLPSSPRASAPPVGTAGALFPIRPPFQLPVTSVLSPSGFTGAGTPAETVNTMSEGPSQGIASMIPHG